MRWSVCKVPTNQYKVFMDQMRETGNPTGRVSLCPMDSTNENPIMRIEVFAPLPCPHCGANFQPFSGPNATVRNLPKSRFC